MTPGIKVRNFQVKIEKSDGLIYLAYAAQALYDQERLTDEDLDRLIDMATMARDTRDRIREREFYLGVKRPRDIDAHDMIMWELGVSAAQKQAMRDEHEADH